MDNIQLDRIVREPIEQSTGKPTGIFLLHGYGSNMHDLFSLANEFPKDAYVIAYNAHLNTPFGGSAWYSLNMEAESIRFNIEDVISAKELIEKNIEKSIDEFNIDKNKIVVVGFSQGAILSYLLGADNPEKIHSVIAFSGYLPDEYKTDKHFENLKKINLFLSHGVHDGIIPIIAARSTEAALNKAEVDFFYEEYNMPHGIIKECLDDAINWLNDKLTDKRI